MFESTTHRTWFEDINVEMACKADDAHKLLWGREVILAKAHRAKGVSTG